jgi:colanic acid/amylovoran biosynthesis glycosyltransferase
VNPDSKTSKIAYLNSEYPYFSQSFILREIQKLRAMGFDIRVVSINLPARAYDEMSLEEQGEVGKTYYVKGAGVFGIAKAHLTTFIMNPVAYLRGLFYSLRLTGADLRKLVPMLAYFIEAVVVGRWMKSEELSHLHVHLANPGCTVGMITSRIYPIEFSFTAHGPDEFYDAPGYRLEEKVARAAFVVCIGFFARSQLMLLSDPHNWDKLEVAPLGVDPDVFTPRPSRPTNDAFEILCVGRLVPAKGQHVLVAAVDRLVKSGRNVRLRLVGGGPDRESLEREVSKRYLGEHVVFEGIINQDQIRELFYKADVFALPSFAEGIPVALMEAMAMGIPCITTFVAGISELIRDGVDGILVAPSDQEGLVHAIERLIDNPELVREFARAGRERVIDKYNLDRNVARLATVFRKRIKEPTIRNSQRSSLPSWRLSEQLPASLEASAQAKALPRN